jgi:hypothetical protein
MSDNAGSTLYGDLSKQGLLDFNYAVMGFQGAQLRSDSSHRTFADYVYRETKRALEGVAGTKTLIWPGIDIDIPTEPNNSKCTPQSVKEAVSAAFRAGAPGVILSRKYSEMRLANLSGAGDAASFTIQRRHRTVREQDAPAASPEAGLPRCCRPTRRTILSVTQTRFRPCWLTPSIDFAEGSSILA